MLPHGETVTIVRNSTPARDENGDWVTGVETRIDVSGCGVAPRTGATDGEVDARGRQGVIIGLSLYAPPGTELLVTYRVEARGALFEVEGEPGQWWNPFLGAHVGVEVALRRAAG